MMETILQQINIENIQIRVALITFIIIINLIFSVIDSIKSKKFDFKKLPEFIWEWMMCATSVIFIEIVISLLGTTQFVSSIMISVREIMLLSILACYIKKIFESFKSLGWDVNADKIINYIDDKKDNI